MGFRGLVGWRGALVSRAPVLQWRHRKGHSELAQSNRAVEPVLAVGPMVGEVLYGKTVPVVTLEAEAFSRIQRGDWVVVDAASGEVYRRVA
ncbi:MAG: hypothetical protein ACE5JD_07085 [Candidatus Methylomirabilia bacterium]